MHRREGTAVSGGGKGWRGTTRAGVRATHADASEPDYARIHRLLKIISLVQGQKGWDAKRLAAECGVAQRTIYRDLQMLEGAGIPYFYDEEHHCYQIRRDFFMKPVDLTLDEALALVALGEHIGGQEQIPFTRPATRAVAKVRSQLPEKIRRELEGLERHLAIKLAAAQSPHGIGDVYDRVRAALAGQRALRCRYDSAAGGCGDAAFLLKPYALFFNQRAWYAVGHHGGHNEVRCLKLNRFTAIEPTNQRYTIPAGFSLKKHLGNAWRMIRGPRTYQVELLFDEEFADTISDTHWHDTQVLDWNDDGTLTFRCKVDGLDEIVWWVLSMGPHCTVKAPKELADRVRDLAGRIAALYPAG